MSQEQTFVEGRVVVKTGDITHEDVDAVVNAANSSLMGGGGVDGAIHRAGGPRILEECRHIRRHQYPKGLPSGEAVITTGGDMKARHVIHTVGPVWKGGQRGEPDTLASCYRASLALAAEKGLQTVAFPAISTGVYGYPRDLAAQVASRAIDDFLKGNATVSQVRLVFFAAADLDVFLQNCVWTRTPPR